jgi:hypothetical protein
MRITPTGNVGIGTTNPSERLDTGTGNTRTQALIISGDQHLLYSADANTLGIRIGTGGPFYGIGTTGSSNMRINNASGGDMLFAIAGTERMRINSSGQVGIGTSSPGSTLDVTGRARLGNGVAQAAPSATDIGSTSHTILSGTGGNALFFGQYPGAQTFAQWIQSSFTNPTTAVYNLILQPLGGNVGIGTTSPADRLHVREDLNGTTGILVQNRSGSGTPVAAVQFITGAFDLSDNRYAMISSSGGSNTILQFWTGAGATPTERARISAAGGFSVGTTTDAGAGAILASGNITAFSDIRLKDNVEQISGALDRVSRIRGVTYTRNDLEDTDRRYAGVIAQEIEQVLPEAVFDSGEMKAVDYNATIGLLIEAIKELRAEVAELKGK